MAETTVESPETDNPNLDEDDRHMTVVSVHPDAESLRLHMEVGRAAFQEFADSNVHTGLALAMTAAAAGETARIRLKVD